MILTNQGFTGKRAEKVIDAFKDKLPLIARSLGDDVPFHVLVARAYDRFRKPLPGMWHHFTRSHNDGVEINMEQSFYVGDAAGRNGDHSCVDRQLAYNVSLPFHTPEEFFRASPQSSAWRWPGKFDAATYDHDGEANLYRHLVRAMLIPRCRATLHSYFHASGSTFGGQARA